MKATLLTIGIILLVIGVIGLVMGYSSVWMWLVLVLGVIGVVWGLMVKKPTVSS